MILMTILICLAVQRYVGLGSALHNMTWLQSYAARMHKIIGNTPLWQGIWGVITLLVPPIFVVAVVNHLLGGWFFNIFKFLFDFFILLFCLDAYDLRHQLAGYFAAYKNEDRKSANDYGSLFIHKSLAETSEEPSSIVRSVTRAIFLHADQRIFAILFWYIVLGPVGAILYYLVYEIVFYAKLPENDLAPFQPAAKFIQAVLDWIPVRLTGLTYALAGHFGHAFTQWLKYLKLNIWQSQEIAYRSGLAALELDETDASSAQLAENYSALSLVDRSIVIWIVVIAIFTLGAWIS